MKSSTCKLFSVLFTIMVSILFFSNCGSYEHQFTDPDEANMRILQIMLFNDSRCSTSHQLSEAAFAPVRNQDLDLCLTEMASLSCSVWSKSDPFPQSCKAMILHLP